MGREKHLHSEAHENDDDGGPTNRNEAAGVREAEDCRLSTIIYCEIDAAAGKTHSTLEVCHPAILGKRTDSRA